MKILFCFHNTDRYSGATKSLIDIVSFLLNYDDVEIVVAFPYKEGTAIEFFKEKNIEIVFLYYRELAYQMSQNLVKKILLFPFRYIRYMKMKKSIFFNKSFINSLGIDVVYTNTSTIFTGALINKYCNVPHLWHLREFREKDHGTKFFFGNKPFYKLLNNNTNEVVVLSNAMKESLIEEVLDSSKIHVIYNDVGKENINPRHNWVENEIINCIIAGSLEKGKGQIDALKGLKYAIELGASIRLDIAGKVEGVYYDVLKQYINKNNLDQYVCFLGFVNDLNNIRHNYDIAIVASHNEAFGRVTIEAMLSQLAVVGADAGGTSEIINDRINGRLYKVADYEELGLILYELYKDRMQIKKLAQSGFNSALYYTDGKCAKKILFLISKMINN